MTPAKEWPMWRHAQPILCMQTCGSSSQHVRGALCPHVATTMPGLSLPGILTGPGKPIQASRSGAGVSWLGLSSIFYGKSTSGLQRLCSLTILFPFKFKDNSTNELLLD